MCKQLLVISLLAELPFVHDEYRVRALYGGEAMGEEDACAAADHAFQRRTNADLSLSVDGTCGFVENEDAGPVRQSTSEADELLLTSGKGRTALEYRLLESPRPPADKGGGGHLISGIHNLLFGNP